MAKPTNVYISIDMEGITGVVDASQTGGDPSEYQYYRKMMALDLNAAIEGAIEGGAEEIVACDSHGGARNIMPEDVHEAAQLIRGTPKQFNMMEGIEEGFDAAFYVGYHSMNGTEKGILCHTISGSRVEAVYINGRETGEFGLNAALAGWYNVPSVFISGDAAACNEAKSFVPELTPAPIKWAVGRLSAKCLHPKTSRQLIKEKAKESLTRLNKVKPFCVNSPLEVKVRWKNAGMADAVSWLPYIDRIDGLTTRAVFDEYPIAMKGLRASIEVAGAVDRR